MKIPSTGGHVFLDCQCHEDRCPLCEGGLTLCTVCGGAEGSLPTACPGVKMTLEQADEVMAGTLDFKDGAWQSGCRS